jgi:hypothetical protein
MNHHDDPSPVDPVGNDAGQQPEQQPRQALQHGGQSHQDRIMGFGRHQQRAGGQGDPVAKTAHPGRSKKPPEGPAQPSRCDRFTETGHNSPSADGPSPASLTLATPRLFRFARSHVRP